VGALRQTKPNVSIISGRTDRPSYIVARICEQQVY
jgi:hypothetical protein